MSDQTSHPNVTVDIRGQGNIVVITDEGTEGMSLVIGQLQIQMTYEQFEILADAGKEWIP